MITIPAGSTNVPYTAEAAGVAAGQPVRRRREDRHRLRRHLPRRLKRHGKVRGGHGHRGGQAGHAGPPGGARAAGSTNIKVTYVANISAGDKIQLDIDSVGHGIETVTVRSVGTQRRDAAAPEDPGTGLDLAAPLKFNHSANIPFSDRGTGSPSSRRRPLPTRATSPFSRSAPASRWTSPWPATMRSMRWSATPRSRRPATRGRRSPTSGSGVPPSRPAPATWCCVTPPAWSSTASTTAASSTHGPRRVTRQPPEPGQSGCYVPAPGAGRGGSAASAAPAAGGPNRSAGRFPDGLDTDSNCSDFLLQTATTLSAASAAGATNIKVASVADFSAGQTDHD